MMNIFQSIGENLKSASFAFKGTTYQEELKYNFRSAASRGDLEGVKIALDKGAGVDFELNSALTWACANGCLEVARFLLDEKDGEKADIHADGALRLAASGGHLEVVRFLLDERKGEKADIHAGNDFALYMAAREGHFEIVRYLLDERKGERADIHAQEEGALSRAAREGHLEIVKFLLEERKGERADIHAENDLALRLAARSGRLEVVHFLLCERKGEKVDLHAEDDAAFKEAVDNHHNEVARYLDLSSLIKGNSENKGELIKFWNEKLKLKKEDMSEDAFQKKEWMETEFVKLATDTALMAATLSPESKEASEEVFLKLLKASLKRIKATPGLTMNKFHKSFIQTNSDITELKDLVSEVVESYILPQRVKENTSLRENDEGELKSVLSDPTSLEEEGAAMGHCVGRKSYVTACQDGKAHIISFRKEGVPVATLELKESRWGEIRHKNGMSFTKKQFKGKLNSDPSPEAKQALKKLSEGFKTGRIKINLELGETRKSRERRKALNILPVERMMGFSVDEIDLQLEAVKVYYSETLRLRSDKNSSEMSLIA